MSKFKRYLEKALTEDFNLLKGMTHLNGQQRLNNSKRPYRFVTLLMLDNDKMTIPDMIEYFLANMEASDYIVKNIRQLFENEVRWLVMHGALIDNGGTYAWTEEAATLRNEILSGEGYVKFPPPKKLLQGNNNEER